MSDLDNTLKDFLRSTRSMESNIVTIISDSNRDIELILKELLIYLDSTAKNLEKIQGSISDFTERYKEENSAKLIANDISNIQTNIIEQVEILSNKIVKLEAENTKKILQFIRRVGVANQNMLKQLVSASAKITIGVQGISSVSGNTSEDIEEIKDLLKIISRDLDQTKLNVSQNQDNLMTVIANFMEGREKLTEANIGVEAQKIKSEEEKTKAKIGLIGKIVGIILGSGGIIYLLIDTLIRAAEGGQ